MTVVSGNQVDRILNEIRTLGLAGNLAAVLVHMNDTYVIQERFRNEPETGRRLDLPGLARVATLVKSIRKAVLDSVGHDRTLVLHSGDFLSPSYMSNVLKFHGRQMAELLACCGVDYVTLGNHEFDHDSPKRADTVEVLRGILNDSPFQVVATNVVAPGSFARWCDVGLWPEDDPFMAIVGLAGRETVDIARRHQCECTPWSETLSRTLANLSSDPRLTCVVALTHMDRDEDQALQRQLNERWGDIGYAYVLGGHDHDIGWRELYQWTSLSKNPSNCRSVTVVIVSNTLAAVPARDFLSREITMDAERPDDAGDEASRALDRAVRGAADYFRTHWSAHRGAARADAYVQHFRQCLEHYGGMVRQDIRYGTAAATLYEMARADTQDEFVHQHFYKVASEDFAGVEPDELGGRAISRWLEEQRRAATGPALPLAFPVAAHGYDATDHSLRRRSTVFGNAIADAVRIATGTDVAFINAGSFRADDFLSGTIDTQSLREVFLHDIATGITVADLTAEEVETCYRHAQTRGGLGGFLQVSATREEMLASGRSRFTVAIVTFLLTHSQDGYQELLARSRGCLPEDVLDRVAVRPLKQASLISLVIEGTQREAINYSDEIRLSALQSVRDPDDEFLDRFIALIDAYLKDCRLATLDRQATRLFLESDNECLRDIRFDAVARGIDLTKVQEHWPILQEHRRRVDALMIEMWRHTGGLRALRRLHKKLTLRREPFELDVPYADYFNNATERLGVKIDDALIRERDKERRGRTGGDSPSR